MKNNAPVSSRLGTIRRALFLRKCKKIKKSVSEVLIGLIDEWLGGIV